MPSTMKGEYDMVKLNENYKLELAKAFTLCAIEHDMLPRYEEPSDTTDGVSKFFRTVFEHIDDDTAK